MLVHPDLAGIFQLFCLVQGLTVQSFDAKIWFWLPVHKPATRYVAHYGAVRSMAIYLGLAWQLWRQHGQHPAWLGRMARGLGPGAILRGGGPRPSGERLIPTGWSA